MKRFVTTAIVLVMTGVLAAPAAATTPTERRLQAQVRVLQKQVKALTKRVASAENLAVGGILIGLCDASATADALQGTWATVEQHEGTGTSLFGAQQPVNDFGVGCKQLGVNRAANQATVAVYQSILNIFK